MSFEQNRLTKLDAEKNSRGQRGVGYITLTFEPQGHVHCAFDELSVIDGRSSHELRLSAFSVGVGRMRAGLTFALGALMLPFHRSLDRRERQPHSADRL